MHFLCSLLHSWDFFLARSHLRRAYLKEKDSENTMKDNALSTDRVVKTCLIITLIQHHLLPTSTSRIFLSPLSSANLPTLSFFLYLFILYVIQHYDRIIVKDDISYFRHSFQIENSKEIWNELKMAIYCNKTNCQNYTQKNKLYR